MALEIRRRRIGGGERAVEIVDIVGRLDVPGSAALRTAVQDVLKEGCPRIVINLTDCVEIHREMMGTLHSLGRACIRAGGGLVLFGATGDVLEYIRRFADRNLAPWLPDEKAAIQALGGQVEVDESLEKESEPPAVVAIGSDPVFRALFWKLSALGGRPVAKFDTVAAGSEFMSRRAIHSVLIDGSLSALEIIGLIRQVRRTPQLKGAGIFVIGVPSQRGSGRTLVEQGADSFVPLVFRGEEIPAKLDRRAFFARLKEIYARFDARSEAKANPQESG